MRIEEAMAAASRAALDCGASCSEAARALGAGMAALGLDMGRFSLTEQARAEEQRALAEQRAGAAEAQRKIEHKLIAMGRSTLMAELAELDVRLRGAHADRIIIDDLVEPAPTIDRMPHSGASADLVLRELGIEPSSPVPGFYLIAGKGTGKTEAMRQWLINLPDRASVRVVTMRDGKPVVLPSLP